MYICRPGRSQATSRDLGTTVVMVTHDADYARRADRSIQLADGKLVSAA